MVGWSTSSQAGRGWSRFIASAVFPAVNISARADLKDQTDITGAQLGGDADHGLQQGAQAGSSTPPARRPGSCAHLWSPIHRSNVINCQKGQKGRCKKTRFGDPKICKSTRQGQKGVGKQRKVFSHPFTKTQNSGDRVWDAVSQKS